LADNSKLIGSKIGEIRFENNLKIRITDVLLVPGLKSNLLSISQFAENGFKAEFVKDKCIITKASNKQVYLTATKGLDNLYYVDGTVKLNNDKGTALVSKVSKDQELELWHCRLGHLSFGYINHAINKSLVDDLSIKASNEADQPFCQACTEGKSHKENKSTKSRTRGEKVGDLIHSDVCGPFKVESTNGSKYFLTFTDDFSGMTKVYFLGKKSETFENFKEYSQYILNQFGHNIKILRSDNGGEYISTQMQEYCALRGIAQQFTNPYTPEQNGVSERKNRTLMESARSMLFRANLSVDHWEDAVGTACYLRNRSPNRSNPEWKTPFELWSGKKPSLKNLRVFGCDAFVHIPGDNRHKLSKRSLKCTFLGYSSQSTGYILMNEDGRYITSKDVTFNEKSVLDISTNAQETAEDLLIEDADALYDLPDKSDQVPEKIQTKIPRNLNRNFTIEIPVIENFVSRKKVRFNDESESTTDTYASNMPEHTEEPTILEEAQNADPTHADGGISEIQEDCLPNNEENINQDSSDDAALTALSSYNDDVNAETALRYAFSIGSVPDNSDPQSYQQAMNSDNSKDWKTAMLSELKSIEDNETWDLVSIPAGRKAIGTKWVFKTKLNADGTVARYKARLVVQGFSQRKGFDYDETFAPVARYTSVRMMLTIAGTNDWIIQHWDVTTAFLHGGIDETVYVKQPVGFGVKGKEHLVYLLKKSLYGLKQAPRNWNKRIHSELIKLGLAQSLRDPCVYEKRTSSEHILMILFVDDIIITSNNMESCDKCFAMLRQAKIDIKNLGELKYSLGIKFERNRQNRTIALDQSKYVNEILTKFKMLDCKPMATPMDTNHALSIKMCPTTPEARREMSNIPYREAVGSLMYLAVSSRPDIATAVNIVSRYLNDPGQEHWTAVKRILRYLRGTPDLKLTLGGTSKLVLNGYADADWGGDLDQRKSTTGYIIRLGDSVISWRSRRQPTVAKSTTEAEYMSLSDCISEMLYLLPILDAMGYESAEAIRVMEDNQGCIAVANNAINNSRAKHIDISYHFIRDYIQKGKFQVVYCETLKMIADIMTKPLSKYLFETHRKAMNL
jgi:hypothetical protein